MKVVFPLFISICLSWTISFGQIKANGKVYVSKTLEYLHLINDSTVWTSIGDENDTTNYYIKDDTLFIKNEYWETGANHKTDHVIKWENYEVIKMSDDSLFLLNKFNGYSRPHIWEDTLFFVNIEKLKEPVTDFKFLKLDLSSPWSGTKQITIDSLGNVTFVDRPILYSIDNPGADKNASPKNIKGQLTQKEFANFKNLLSKSLLSRLPFKRGCRMDGARSNFEILIGTRKINSTGCNLSWTHAFLLNYLYDIDQNNGLKKDK